MPAVTESIADEAARLVNLSEVETATARLREAEAWLEAGALQAKAADLRAEQARDAASALVAAEVAGQELAVSDIVAAHDKAHQLAVVATHRASVHQARREPVERAQVALADAKHAAWGVVLQRGADCRIRAAAEADRARMLAQVGDGATEMQRALAAAAAEKAMAAARPLWDRGCALIELAIGRGHRWRGSPMMAMSGWGDRPSESYERRYWNRPLASEQPAEVADAA